MVKNCSWSLYMLLLIWLHFLFIIGTEHDVCMADNVSPSHSRPHDPDYIHSENGELLNIELLNRT
jgi:hypothetical protein